MTRAEQLASLASGPYLAACLLLAYAGVAKLRSGRPWIGATECALAAAAIAFGGPLAAVVAVLYGTFTVYVARLVLTASDKPCACLGAASAPATGAHVVLNLGAALVAAASVVADTPVTYVARQPLGGVPYVVLVACCAWLGALVLGAYADVRAATTEGIS